MDNSRFKFRAFDLLSGMMMQWHDIKREGITVTDFFESEHFEVMEFIGLKDKHDKEMYEGDIVVAGIKPWFRYPEEAEYWNGECEYKQYTVQFLNGIFILVREGGYRLTLSNACSFEVIGNIYLNPELLKEST